MKKLAWLRQRDAGAASLPIACLKPRVPLCASRWQSCRRSFVPPRDDLPVAATKTISSWGVPETAAAACNPGFLYPGMPRNRQSISHVFSPVRPSISQERLGFDYVCRPRGLCMMPSLETKSMHFARSGYQCWICEDKEPGCGAVHRYSSICKDTPLSGSKKVADLERGAKKD